MRIPGSSIRLDIPEASLRRLPIYYRSLQEMRRNGVSQVSCSEIARVLGFDPTQVRKDIEVTGVVEFPTDLLDGWYDAGARVIGGCCGIGPRGIAGVSAWRAARRSAAATNG